MKPGMCKCDMTMMPTTQIDCCGQKKAATCNLNTGAWLDPVCDVAPGKCECTGKAPPRINCCGATLEASCNHDSGEWLAPMCTTPSGKCQCKAPQPDDVSCCQEKLPPTCNDFGVWEVPKCEKAGTCECLTEMPGPTECGCGNKAVAHVCNKNSGLWEPGVCPSTECSPGDKPRECTTVAGTGTQECNASCKWDKCQVGCDTTPKCLPCKDGLQLYTCNGYWNEAGGCVPRANACDSLGDRASCTLGADAGVGTQSCDDCAWTQCEPDL
jgi:hypothetical protein